MVNVFGERGGSWDCIHRLGVEWEGFFRHWQVLKTREDSLLEHLSSIHNCFCRPWSSE